jgi:hypothetical protein
MTFWDISGLGSFVWIISIVSSIAHRSLETVTITMSADDIMEKTGALEHLSASLTALDSLFMNEPLFNNSTKLWFLIDGVNKVVVRATVKDGLPRLDGKKRLFL